ncbi:hypothetical protein [Pseudomonas viridiflava]|uniref:hypothetical protein n=1 Tax=Pseudomonas viridiflava TaxID=33069 RepID=UPI0013E0E571|nr:hypothetical protein [Pseudomonas viridiflava]
MATLLPIQASDNALNDSAVSFTVKRNGDQWLGYGISEAVTIAAFLFGQHLSGKPHIFTDSSSEGVDYLIWIFPVLTCTQPDDQLELLIVSATCIVAGCTRRDFVPWDI